MALRARFRTGTQPALKTPLVAAAAKRAVPPPLQLVPKTTSYARAQPLDQFIAAPKVVEVNRAQTAAEIEACRTLVFTSYEGKGYLMPEGPAARENGTYHRDQTHASPAARRRGQTFFVQDEGGTIITTGTLVRDTAAHVSKKAAAFGLPLDKASPAQMAIIRQRFGSKAVLGEVGALASSAQATSGFALEMLRALRRGELRSHPVTALFLAIAKHVDAQGITNVVVGVNPTHALFYAKMGFTQLEGSAGYEGLQNAAVVVLHTKTGDFLARLRA